MHGVRLEGRTPFLAVDWLALVIDDWSLDIIPGPKKKSKKAAQQNKKRPKVRTPIPAADWSPFFDDVTTTVDGRKQQIKIARAKRCGEIVAKSAHPATPDHVFEYLR